MVNLFDFKSLHSRESNLFTYQVPSNYRYTITSSTDGSPTDSSPTDCSPTDSSPTDISPTDSSPIDSSPTDSSPTASSPTGLFTDRTVHRQDSSPTGLFADRRVFRQDFLLTGQKTLRMKNCTTLKLKLNITLVSQWRANIESTLNWKVVYCECQNIFKPFSVDVEENVTARWIFHVAFLNCFTTSRGWGIAIGSMYWCWPG